MQHAKQGQWKTSGNAESTFKMTMKARRRKLNTDIIYGLERQVQLNLVSITFFSPCPCEITNDSVPAQSKDLIPCLNTHFTWNDRKISIYLCLMLLFQVILLHCCSFLEEVGGIYMLLHKDFMNLQRKYRVYPLFLNLSERSIIDHFRIILILFSKSICFR